MDRDETVRQQIVNELQRTDEPLSVRDLSKLVHASEREIVAHLPHIKRSLQKSGKKLHLVPASCRKCGFKFTGKRDFKKPSRCPACRSEFISSPRLKIAS